MSLFRTVDDKTTEPAARSAHPFGAVTKFVPAPVRRMHGRFNVTARVLGRIGSLEVRLARSREEVKAAQQLRYRIFYEEMTAQPSALQRVLRRDMDLFDLYCDHLLVIDRDRIGPLSHRIVGTYRVMRESGAALAGRFYTAQEFDLDPLLRRHAGKRFLELGRSCVMKEYRVKRTVELLWQGIWSYVLEHRIDVMFGCASLAGTKPRDLALPLSFLKANATAPAEWNVEPLPVPGRAVRLDAFGACENQRKALMSLPPLLKGYLRLGGYIGNGAMIDFQFGVTDVLIVLPVANINPRYVDYYGADAGRFAA